MNLSAPVGRDAGWRRRRSIALVLRTGTGVVDFEAFDRPQLLRRRLTPIAHRFQAFVVYREGEVRTVKINVRRLLLYRRRW